jgi:hypothetical protein
MQGPPQIAFMPACWASSTARSLSAPGCSSDGTQLVASNDDSQSIHVWDLRAIREQLAKIRLDWDLPPYPPAGPDEGQRLHVRTDRGDLDAMIQGQNYRQQAIGFLQSKQWDKAIGAYAQAIELEPKNANTLSALRSALTIRRGPW